MRLEDEVSFVCFKLRPKHGGRSAVPEGKLQIKPRRLCCELVRSLHCCA